MMTRNHLETIRDIFSVLHVHSQPLNKKHIDILVLLPKIQQLQFLNVGCSRIKLISKSGRGRDKVFPRCLSKPYSEAFFRRLLPKTVTVTDLPSLAGWLRWPLKGLPKRICFFRRGLAKQWVSCHDGWDATGVLPKLPSELLSRITDLNTSSILQRFLPKRLLGGFQNNCRRQTKC